MLQQVTDVTTNGCSPEMFNADFDSEQRIQETSGANLQHQKTIKKLEINQQDTTGIDCRSQEEIRRMEDAFKNQWKVTSNIRQDQGKKTERGSSTLLHHEKAFQVLPSIDKQKEIESTE